MRTQGDRPNHMSSGFSKELNVQNVSLVVDQTVLSFGTFNHLFLRLPSFSCNSGVWAFVCFALVFLLISVLFVQLLLFVQETSVSYLNSCLSFET